MMTNNLMSGKIVCRLHSFRLEVGSYFSIFIRTKSQSLSHIKSIMRRHKFISSSCNDEVKKRQSVSSRHSSKLLFLQRLSSKQALTLWLLPVSDVCFGELALIVPHQLVPIVQHARQLMRQLRLSRPQRLRRFSSLH